MDGTAFFGPWEGELITSWDAATESLEKILKLVGSKRRMAWRGQVNAAWCLHSGLYRRVLSGASAEAPVEDDLLKAEDKLLTIARDRWRVDQMPYLELVAHMQHYGAPTRLLDVSLNPLVALWFAVEEQRNEDGEDGRVFAFDVTDRSVRLDTHWSTYDIPWRHTEKTSKWSLELPLLWRPPSYNERIPAQQSGFLLAGVPKFYAGFNSQYRRGPGDGSTAGLWSADDVRRATSVPTSMVSQTRKLRQSSRPTLTLRIAAHAKEKIRLRLERDYGINSGTMYPDLFGMATSIREIVDYGHLLTRS